MVAVAIGVPESWGSGFGGGSRPAWAQGARRVEEGIQAAVDDESGGMERRLRRGSARLASGARRTFWRVSRVLAVAAQRWSKWGLEALFWAMGLVLVAICDRRLWRVGWSEGWVAARGEAALAAAVYIRILFDRRVPSVGRALLGCAVTYGVAPNDLLPDHLLPMGLLDDLIALTVCSNCFVRLCPDAAIKEHVQRARGARALALRRKTAAESMASGIRKSRSGPGSASPN